jgi:DUF1016 N-terminal domain
MPKKKQPIRRLIRSASPSSAPAALLDDLRALIRQTREAVAQAVNSALVVLFWQVGHRIRTEILEEKRGAYGEQIVSTVSSELTAEFGDGFSRPNLFRMVGFAETFPDREIVSTLSRQLSFMLLQGARRDRFSRAAAIL